MTFTRITSDPKKMNGKPCIRNLHLTVHRVLNALATYPSRQEMLKDYPELEEADINEALTYAAACLEEIASKNSVANGALNLDLEEDTPELAAELLKAAKGPFTPYSRQDLEKVAEQVLRETNRE